MRATIVRDPRPMPFSRILVPVDFADATDEIVHAGLSVSVGAQDIEFAPASARALVIAASLVAQSGELRLLHATPNLEHARVYGMGGMSSAISEIYENAARASLEVLQALASLHCKNVKTSFAAPPGSAVKTILDEAERYDADLIIIAASGRSRVERFFVGSTADRVIREARCPVLVIPSDVKIPAGS